MRAHRREVDTPLARAESAIYSAEDRSMTQLTP